MVKPFSSTEKNQIKEKIYKETKLMIEEVGYKSTSIQKITEKVGIAKGSFYRFFTSKESMVFDLLLQLEWEMHTEMMEKINIIKDHKLFLDNFYTSLIQMIKRIDSEPILKIMREPEVFNRIISCLDEESFNIAAKQDKLKSKEIIEMIKKNGYFIDCEPEILIEMMRSFAILYFNRKLIGSINNRSIDRIIKTSIYDIIKYN